MSYPNRVLSMPIILVYAYVLIPRGCCICL